MSEASSATAAGTLRAPYGKAMPWSLRPDNWNGCTALCGAPMTAAAAASPSAPPPEPLFTH